MDTALGKILGELYLKKGSYLNSASRYVTTCSPLCPTRQECINWGRVMACSSCRLPILWTIQSMVCLAQYPTSESKEEEKNNQASME